MRVEERMADRARLLVGCMFDLGFSGCDCLISFEYRVYVVQHVFSWDVFHYIFASSLFSEVIMSYNGFVDCLHRK